MQLSDNDLDKLSQEAAENFEPGGASPDWGKMELLLNKHLPVNKKPRRRIFILLFVFLFILGGGYLYNNFSSKDESTITEKADSTTPNSTASTATNKIILTTEKDAVRLTKFEVGLQDMPIYVLPIEHAFLFTEAERFNTRIISFIRSFKEQ